MTDELQTWKARQYYEKPIVQQKILQAAEKREAVPRYQNSFGHRPDVIETRGDVNHFSQQKAVEFHVSVEKWKNPLLIDETPEPELLRTGWDLIIDIDCDHSLDLARGTAQLIIKELKNNGIQKESIGLKYSGNRGFHLAITQKAFPEEIDGEPIENTYPETPKKILTYLRKQLKKEMTELVNQYVDREVEDPYTVSDIEHGWGDRHLFKAPYSLHMKTGLVSLPIPVEKLEDFSKEEAKIENVGFRHNFLVNPQVNEAETLLKKALNHAEKHGYSKNNKNPVNKDMEFTRPEEAIPKKHFPPTIKKILEGVEDGRKRAVLILCNFLHTVGYDWDSIEKMIHQWNQRNKEPLDQQYINTQIEWHKKRGKTVPPPNYDTNGFYKDMQVYQGEQDPNPVSYAYRKKREQENNNSSSSGLMKCKLCGKIYKFNEEAFEKHKQKCANT